MTVVHRFDYVIINKRFRYSFTLPETYTLGARDSSYALDVGLTDPYPSISCYQALESSGHKKKRAREKETRVSPSRAPVLSFAHYFQAPATQSNLLHARNKTSGLVVLDR